jgi:cephalosporin-C deacetylase
MWFDLSEEELRSYHSSQEDPVDFDDFWTGTLRQAEQYDLNVTRQPVATGLTEVEVFDVTFAGYGGTPVRAWLRLPVARKGNLPVVVEFVGYGGGRGHALDQLLWSTAGFAHLVMDTRGQGSSWSRGQTPDPEGTGPAYPGVMTRGIESPDTYYYRRLFVDAVRAVQAARSLHMIDPERVALIGNSQGGGIALAAGTLIGNVSAVFTRVPFLSDFRRAITVTDKAPYKEIAAYLKTHREAVDQVHNTLRYFDTVNFARRATAPAWFSVALMDQTTPPSTIFGAYNAYTGPKQIAVWPFNEHEGGGVDDDVIALTALHDVFGTGLRL